MDPAIDLSQVSSSTIDSILDEIDQNEAKYSLKQLSMDSLKRSDSSINKCSAETPIIDNCIEVKRLVTGLLFYSSLDFDKNKCDKDKLLKYCNEAYQELLNDYIHLIMKHNDNLEQINADLLQRHPFMNCDPKTCNFTDRHYNYNGNIRNNKKVSNFSEEADFICFRETFDSIHYYLFHLFDNGLRIKSESIPDEETNNIIIEEKKEDKSIQNTTNKKVQIVKNTANKEAKKLNRFDSNKFTINISNLNIADDETYIDLMMEYLKTNDHYKVQQDEMDKLVAFLNDNQYDSDAIKEDTSNNHSKQSNISNHIQNVDCMECIERYVRYTKLSSSAFSVGLIFYYWPYYKSLSEGKKQTKIEQKTNENNVNDHSGYEIKDLYVKQKFAYFKQEILEHISIDEYNVDVRGKAMRYKDTDIVKGIKAADGSKMNMRHLQYGIKYGRPIQINHLMSLILYCDFTTLSKDFSATFRPIKIFESLESIKKRNANYWHLSKSLRETVQFYGENKYYNSSHGPFFCGMSSVMVIPQFNIRLCSPTSTSKQISVAERFGGAKGMLMQLNNNGDRFSSKYLRFFNCSWISRYKEEDERLFMGGDRRVRIESIRDLLTKQNFGAFFHALFYFDSMVNGGMMSKQEMDINARDRFIIDSLIKYEIGVVSESKIYAYILNTFHLFCIKKTQLILNFSHLYQYFKKLSDLVVNSVERTYVDECNIGQLYGNMIHNVILKLFPNANKLIIYSTHWSGDYSYAFSLSTLLKFINNASTKNLEIIIKASHNWRYKDKRSWIWNVWSTPQGPMIKRLFYNKLLTKRWKMSMKITKNSQDRQEDCLFIRSL